MAGLRGLAGLPRLLVSLLVGLFLLAVFAPLMAGADPAFGAVLDGLISLVDGSSVWWMVRFAAGAVVVLAAAVPVAARTVPPLGPARPSPLPGVGAADRPDLRRVRPRRVLAAARRVRADHGGRRDRSVLDAAADPR